MPETWFYQNQARRFYRFMAIILVIYGIQK